MSLPGTLAVLQAEVEIKAVKGSKIETRWVPVARLYNRNGDLLLERHELISRIRVDFERESFAFQLSAGSPMRIPNETVMFAFICSYFQSIINRFHMCITFPSSLFSQPTALDITMQGIQLPLSTQQIEKVVVAVIEEIKDVQRGAHPIQLMRARRFVEEALHELNAKNLAERE